MLNHPEDYDPAWADLQEGEFKRVEGLKYPLTDADKAENLVHISDAEQDELNDLISFCKTEAKRRIILLLNVSPGSDYRDVEINLTVKNLYLTRLESKGLATPGQIQMIDDGQALWLSIEAIREASNLIEPYILNGLIKTEDQISTDERWSI